MQLSFQQIQSITTGALRIWQEADGIHFHRCTEQQSKAWYAIDEGLGWRGESTTGIRLDFHTNSKYFAFTVAKPGVFEVNLDGILRYSFTNYNGADFGDLRKEIPLDGEEHRITLFLPSHSAGVLQSVELSDGASFCRHTYDKKILFFGASITQCWDSKWDSLSFAYGVSHAFNAESVVQGIGGAIFHETTFDPAIDFDPDVVLVDYGTNDWGHYKSLEELREHCAKYLDLVAEKYAGKPILAVTPIWREDIDQPKSMGTFEECTAIIREQIVSHGLILLEGLTMVPHSMDFFADAVHPNALGFGVYALRLIEEIRKYL